MLATFMPFAFVFVFNKRREYFLARLIFILLPLITTVFWMFIGSSQEGLIHYLYLIFPIPIVILFKDIKTQWILVVLSFIAFLMCHYIILKYPAFDGSYSNQYFSQIVVGIFILISFLMLRFFVLEVEKAEENLKVKNAELEEFSRIASHDMREPLRTISNFTTLIKKKHSSELSDQVTSYLDYVEYGVSRLDTLLSDLSNYSTLDIVDESLKDVDLNVILEDVKSDLKLLIEETGTVISSKNLPVIRARKSHMTQLFQNLIHNGIKFQPLDGSTPPAINISSKLVNDFHHISFQDNGIGIQEQFLDQIFLKFRRLHRRDKYEGTGLGLATCKRIVEKYNGNIFIKSKVGEGTTITLKFMSQQN